MFRQLFITSWRLQFVAPSFDNCSHQINDNRIHLLYYYKQSYRDVVSSWKLHDQLLLIVLEVSAVVVGCFWRSFFGILLTRLHWPFKFEKAWATISYSPSNHSPPQIRIQDWLTHALVQRTHDTSSSWIYAFCHTRSSQPTALSRWEPSHRKEATKAFLITTSAQGRGFFSLLVIKE